MELDLKLDKAKQLIHQRDVVKEQQPTLKLPIKEENTLDVVGKRNPKESCLQFHHSKCHLELTAEVVEEETIPDNPVQLRKSHVSIAAEKATMVHSANSTSKSNRSAISSLDTIEATNKNMWDVQIEIKDKCVFNMKIPQALPESTNVSLWGRSTLMVMGKEALCLSYQGNPAVIVPLTVHRSR